MTDKITLAFDDLQDRSKADGNAHLDRISLRNHIVDVEIGAFQQERDTTQRISFDVVVEVRQLDPSLKDDVDRILSYDRMTWAIEHELNAERLNLLETLAERVADRILLEPQAQRVFVRIQKLDRGNGELGVEIVRDRAEAARIDQQEAPRPIVMFLSNTAFSSGHLQAWIDQLCATEAPILLCVDIPDLTRPLAQTLVNQRNIDLLAIEQSAWVLASLNDRFEVVATRTELDWAMKNDQVSIWAPAKIVLDAVDGPQGSDGAELALWFARETNAVKLISIGKTLPECADIDVLNLSADVRTL